MPYYVRPMTKEDIPAVNEIDREAFPTQWPPPNFAHELGNQFAHYLVACDSDRITELSAPPPGGLSGVARRIGSWFSRDDGGRESRVVTRSYTTGFAGIWIMADESHLTNIAVRQSYQRRGIGELLLLTTMELSMRLGADIVTLEVRVSNTLAQNLYRRWGFTQTGLRRAYYTDNREDAMIMSTESINLAAFQGRFQELRQAYRQKYGPINFHPEDIPAPRGQL